MPAKLGTFRVWLLPSIAHTEETKRILDGLNGNNKSVTIREAIIELAESLGFSFEETRTKPDYLTDKQWRIYTKSQSASREVDYSYYVAFYWLMAQEAFQYAPAGVIVRLALERYQHETVA